MSELPAWSKALRHALVLERQAEEIKDLALGLRCAALESGGARCTRDRHEGGEHAYIPRHLPRGAETCVELL